MGMTAVKSLRVVLPAGGTVSVDESAIQQDVSISVTCDNSRCNKGNPLTIAWEQSKVAAEPGALPRGAFDLQTLQKFDGTTFVFCGLDCLIMHAQDAKQPPIPSAVAKPPRPSGIHLLDKEKP